MNDNKMFPGYQAPNLLGVSMDKLLPKAKKTRKKLYGNEKLLYIGFAVPESLLDLLDTKVTDNDMSRSRYIRSLITKDLKNAKKSVK